ncbi:MAG TPA: DUF4301 family protein [Thermoanaerobaculia bacterium]|nr:DUF4301 family protein [Thermoanaerobaculia bacterium]
MTNRDFSDRDRAEIRNRGIATEEAERQLALFRSPPPPLVLDRPATVGDGILRLGDDERARLADRAIEAQAAGGFVKFVPASGAASRMFGELEAALHTEDRESDAGRIFLARLRDFPFFEDLAAALADAGEDLAELARRRALQPILDALLTEAGGHGLGYATLPKGLIRFHRYPAGERRTAFDEHLVEAVAHLRDGSGLCRLHFTVSPEHGDGFTRRLAAVGPRYGERYHSRFEVAWSHQDHATDTLAVDLADRPFRGDDGRLLFRPGGHGSLIGNLQAAGGDVTFVKNIDNVLPDGRKPEVIAWKRTLAGKLLELRERSFGLLADLEDGGRGREATLAEAARFLGEDLRRSLPEALVGAPADERRRAVVERLDRPLRVCGVVENAGEPGGGPFWVESGGELSLQIVEASQVAADDPGQQATLRAATHFNPVDLVCSLADRHRRPYDLSRFVDPSTVFIAEKSHQGRRLKALERPGLWNGGMAGWNTVFVEVPLATFAPVKTVFDLLRPEHQTGVPPAAG